MGKIQPVEKSAWRPFNSLTNFMLIAALIYNFLRKKKPETSINKEIKEEAENLVLKKI
jgi:hypothetical protein